DVSESDVLFERYGLTIPVLKREDDAELNWPFDAARLAAFVS
ncbi:MAG: glutaredoxin family protein, partial [Halieaceae bacterium]|nr:glutaredoxin family protein [Halieaceae bacterium]